MPAVLKADFLPAFALAFPSAAIASLSAAAVPEVPITNETFSG